MEWASRTAALRLFVRNIAHVYVPLRTTAPRLAQYKVFDSRADGPCCQKTAAALPIAPSHALHTSCARGSAAEAAQAVHEVKAAGVGHDDATAVNHTAARGPEPASDRPSETESHDVHTGAAGSKLRKGKAGKESSSVEDSKTRWRSDKSAKKAKKEKKKEESKPGRWDEDDDGPRKKEDWMIQKEALKKKFPEGWQPRKKLSPDAMIGIRALHKQFPKEYTTKALAAKFEVSPEAIRRILKSKWTPSPKEAARREERWFNRGKKVWSHWAELGRKPPRKWRAEGVVRDPYWNRPRTEQHEARAEAQRKLSQNLMG